MARDTLYAIGEALIDMIPSISKESTNPVLVIVGDDCEHDGVGTSEEDDPGVPRVGDSHEGEFGPSRGW